MRTDLRPAWPGGPALPADSVRLRPYFGGDYSHSGEPSRTAIAQFQRAGQAIGHVNGEMPEFALVLGVSN